MTAQPVKKANRPAGASAEVVAQKAATKTPATKTPATRTAKATALSKDDPRPLEGYASIMVGYAALSGALVLALRRKRLRLAPLGPMDLVLYGLATEHLSRLITKDSVTSFLRAPFTRFEGPAGEGEVNEEVVGTGHRHAIGELLTCPFCAAQWVATGLVAGSVAAPTLTTAVISVSAAARLSDYFQLFYGLLRKEQ